MRLTWLSCSWERWNEVGYCFWESRRKENDVRMVMVMVSDDEFIFINNFIADSGCVVLARPVQVLTCQSICSEWIHSLYDWWSSGRISEALWALKKVTQITKSIQSDDVFRKLWGYLLEDLCPHWSYGRPWTSYGHPMDLNILWISNGLPTGSKMLSGHTNFEPPKTVFWANIFVQHLGHAKRICYRAKLPLSKTI